MHISICVSSVLLFHPFYLFQIFTHRCLSPKSSIFSPERFIFFSAMCWEHTTSPEGFLSEWYISFLQILKQDLICKVRLLHCPSLQHSGCLFFNYYFFSFPTLLCFVSSLWVIERPVYMLQAVSPAAVTFPVLAFITLHYKRIHKIGFRLNLDRSIYYSCSSNQALLEHFLNTLLCVQMFQE